MDLQSAKLKATSLLQKWGWSLLLLPFIYYSLHQAYRALRFNIFFSISYDFPFPVNIVHLMLNSFLLIVHEAGHTFFSILGWRTLTILGGSVLECLLPALILVYFWMNNRRTGMQLSLYLLGFSLLRISYYIADAPRRQLPLLGNLPKEAHDWHNLLVQWHALEFNMHIATAVLIMAVICYIGALLVPAFHRSYRNIQLDLDV